jgi:tetratricopeptide (TPR) repeat protein
LYDGYLPVAKHLEPGRDWGGAKAEDVQRVVKGWVAANPKCLVIFDNVDEPNALEGYWPGTGRVLVTSRRKEVEGKYGLTAMRLEAWGEKESPEFLLKRTGRRDPDAAEAEAIAGLAKETGHLPLALEQAGAYIQYHGISFVEYLKLYKTKRLELLEESGPQAGGYQDSVATTFALSIQQLGQRSVKAREVVEGLAHLAPAGNPVELLQGLVPGEDVAALLAHGEAYSLLKLDRAARTVSAHTLLLEVIRYYQSPAERQEWLRRWLGVFGAFLPKDAKHAESAPHSRAFGSFEEFFLRFGEGDAQVVEVCGLASSYAFHFFHRGRWRDAERIGVHLLQLRNRVLGVEHPDTLTSVNNLASLYTSQGRYGEAEPLLVGALEASERVLVVEHPDTLTSMNNLALLYASQGQYGKAEPLYERALEARKRVLGVEHPDTLTSMNNLAVLYESQERYGEAEPLFVRALEARERVLGVEHPDTLTSVNTLANLYSRKGRYGEAEKLFGRALEARERVLGVEHPATLTSVNNLAELSRWQGRYGEAEPLLVPALEASERVLGAVHPDTLISVNNLAGLYAQTGRLGKANDLLRNALRDCVEKLGPEHPTTQLVRENLRKVRRRMKRDRL